MSEFRAAVEARDLDAMMDCFTEDAVFNSPVSHRPFTGRDTVRVVLGSVLEVLENFEYTDEYDGDGRHALVFRAGVGDREVQGIDLLTYDGDGRIADLTVLIRPLSGLMAVAEAMGRRLEARGLDPKAPR